MVSDREATEKMVQKALDLINDELKCQELKQNIAGLAKPNATSDIVKELKMMLN